MHFPTFTLENELFTAGHRVIIGCDEVGRGCLAGPVVAAAVAFRWDAESFQRREGLLAFVRDSKVLSPLQRARALGELQGSFIASAIGQVTAKEVDRINIHRASLLAMRKAIHRLRRQVGDQGFVVIDGKYHVPYLRYPQRAVIDGDADIFSVAAASIIAKEFRDRLMERMDGRYPGYGFVNHVGYATKAHRDAIARLGLTPLHRQTFCKRTLVSATIRETYEADVPNIAPEGVYYT